MYVKDVYKMYIYKNVYVDILCFFIVSAIEAKYIIIKGVCNIIGIGYSIMIIKGQYP